MGSDDGNHPLLGSWIIDGEPAGIGIREVGAQSCTVEE
jgi:glutathionylspermidine synthase